MQVALQRSAQHFGIFLAESVNIARQLLGIVHHFIDGRSQGFFCLVQSIADAFDHMLIGRYQLFAILDIHPCINNA